METLKLSAYAFFVILLIGVAVHLYEYLAASGTFYGIVIAVIGVIGEILAFAIHVRQRRRIMFHWNSSHVGLIAITIIVVGIAINIAFDVINPEYTGIGNYFITFGFVVAVVGLFLIAIKEKAFNRSS